MVLALEKAVAVRALTPRSASSIRGVTGTASIALRGRFGRRGAARPAIRRR